MSLRNRTILITRPKEQAGEMAREIEHRGGVAVVVPMISIDTPASWRECDDAIAHLADYDAVVFTSANAVDSFFGRANVLGVPSSTIAAARVVTVGEKTASAARSYGAQVVIVPEQFSGASLAAVVGTSYAGKRVLFPRGNIGREEVLRTLQDAGATVDAVTVYVTGKPEGRACESLARRVMAGEFDVITFASPSAAANFCSLFTAAELTVVSEHAKIAVIGPSTADAVRGLGLPVDVVARESTSHGLVHSIDEYYS